MRTILELFPTCFPPHNPYLALMTATYKNAHKFSVAPMMDWTDRHCRMFHRMLSTRALLYTEMVVADAVIHGDRDYLIGFNEAEHPVALQIGGSDPAKLAQASKVGEDYGYKEININIGCPSDRVQSGRFGACLMAEPDLVAECYQAMAAAVDIPVTVKCRLGIDQQDAEQTLPLFIETVKAAGCSHFIIHARKAWLDGLSPKENRTVPPLDYDLVRRMKQAYPELTIILNGGLEDLQHAEDEMGPLDGAMFGRAAYHTPWILSDVDARVFGEPARTLRRDDIVVQIIEYLKSVESDDRSAKAMVRHIMGLYHGEPGARVWRRGLSEAASDLLPSQKVEQAFELFTSVRDKAA